MGYGSKKGAFEAVQRELQRRLIEPADQLRDIELMRLDRAQVAIWKTITDPEAPFEQVDKAVKTYIQLSKRRSDLLGLDAPKKVDISRQIREMAMAEGLDPDQALKDAETVLAQFDAQG